MASLAVSWAWARSRFHRSEHGLGSSSYFGSPKGESGSVLNMSSVQSIGSTNGTPRLSRRRLRIWSRPACLDDVVMQLEKHTSHRGVLIHTADRGFTEHANNFAAIAYLKSLLHERRQPRLPEGHRSASASRAIRRRPRSSSPAPLKLDNEINTVQTSAADSLKRIPSAVREETEREMANEVVSFDLTRLEGKGRAVDVASDAETCLPDDDKDERLREVQLVLDGASPHEMVGLGVIIDGENGIVKTYSAKGGFLVSLKSGIEVSLARVEASHVLGCLPEWA